MADLEFLQYVPKECIQSLITSPPYFGHRNYGLPPEIFGGDPACDHDWSNKKYYPPTKVGKIGFEDPKWKTAQVKQKIEGSRFCIKCDAWVGWLGAEPSPYMFIGNMVSRARAWRPHMTPLSSLFIVVGDTYAGSGGSWGITENTPSVRARGGKMNFHDVGDAVNPTEKSAFMDMYLKLGFKKKDLLGIPHQLALALRNDGWWWRSDIIWYKPSPKPHPFYHRWRTSHEHILHFTNGYDSFMNPMQMKNGAGAFEHDVWIIDTSKLPKYLQGKHHATFPEEIPKRIIQAATPPLCCMECYAPQEPIIETGKPKRNAQKKAGGAMGQYKGKSKGNPEKAKAENASNLKRRILKSMRKKSMMGWRPTCKCDGDTMAPIVFDPFGGLMTTAVVAKKLNRNFLSCDLSGDYVDAGKMRLHRETPSVAMTRW